MSFFILAEMMGCDGALVITGFDGLTESFGLANGGAKVGAGCSTMLGADLGVSDCRVDAGRAVASIVRVFS